MDAKDQLQPSLLNLSSCERVMSPTENFIHGLDEKTSASLKFTVLNSAGRIWTMVAGGGASVIYADTVCFSKV